MRELSLFSGAGGGLLGTHLLGWRPVGYVEFDDYCQRVIRARIDDGILHDAPIFGDIRAFLSEGYADSYQGMVDVVTAGFPCQPHSTAARGRQRLDKDLWNETAEVICRVRPRWVLLENSTRAFPDQVPVICPSVFGSPHRRPRGWMVAHADGESESRRSEHAEVAGIPSLPGCAWWSEDMAASVGVDDVLANRMDRLKAIGNGQFPAVVRAAWELLA